MGFWRSLAKVGGAAGGFVLGGPAGAAAGYQLGSIGEGGGSQPPSGPAPIASRRERPGAALASTANAHPAYDPAPDQAGVAAARSRYETAAGSGQNELNAYTTSAINQGMPALRNTLQGIREGTARRGISNGEIAAGYEGRAVGDFSQNIANAVGSQAVNIRNSQQAGAADLYGKSLGSRDSNREFDRAGVNSDREYQRSLNNDERDWEASQLDRQTASDNASAQRKSNVWGSILNTGAQLGGAYLASRGNGTKIPNRGYAGSA